MSKLHKKMVALGDLSQYTRDDIAAACGKPKSTAACEFTDIGRGTRSTWSDGVFTITLNFDSGGRYCGIHRHSNLEPYIWLAGITVLIVAAALVAGAAMRRNASRGATGADTAAAFIIDGESAWKGASTAGICLADLDFDGTPELLVTDTAIVRDDESRSDYYGTCTTTVWSLSGGKFAQLGSFAPDDYCFLTAIHLYTDGAGNRGWYYASGGDIRLLSFKDGAFSTSAAAAAPDTSGGDEPVRLLQNVSWIGASGASAGAETVNADIRAAVQAYFSGAQS